MTTFLASSIPAAFITTSVALSFAASDDLGWLRIPTKTARA